MKKTPDLASFRIAVWTTFPGHHHNRTANEGFTLVEVLASSIILLISTIGAIAAFNLITQSVQGTGLRVEQSRAIDADISEISRLSELFTSCVNAAGSIPENPPADCTGLGVQVGNSYYYFPDPGNTTDVQNFFTACRSGAIANNFIGVLNDFDDFSQPGGGVTRQNAIRVDGTNPVNHLVQINWVDANQPARVLRSIQITPILSSWCP